jgi:glycosyltransferase involved in cell wall biosynthesis
MKRKKVLLLADNLNNGGAERQMLLLAKNIPETWDVFLWSIEDGIFSGNLQQAKIKYKTSPRKFQFDISPIFDLARTVKEYQPDLLHSWGWMSTLSGILVSKIFNIPLVNGIIRTAKPYYYRGSISKILSRYGDYITANAQVSLINWEISPGRSAVIYNGFEWQRLENVLPKNSRDGIFRVVMTARMVKAKDFQLFTEAARHFHKQGRKNWKFLAIGHGDQKVHLMQDNADLIAAGMLEFPEAGTEVIPFLVNSDVGVLLTKKRLAEEGLSNTIMEYMACGLPVIATSSGGNKELIDEQTGFLISDGSLAELIENLTWLYNHRQEAANMGNNGKTKLIDKFSVEQLVQNTLNVYQHVIEQKNNEKTRIDDWHRPK